MGTTKGSTSASRIKKKKSICAAEHGRSSHPFPASSHPVKHSSQIAHRAPNHGGMTAAAECAAVAAATAAEGRSRSTLRAKATPSCRPRHAHPVSPYGRAAGPALPGRCPRGLPSPVPPSESPPPPPPPPPPPRSAPGCCRPTTRTRPAPGSAPHPAPPLVTVVDIVPAEDIEQAVGRRRKAHPLALGRAGAGGGQRRPGVGRRAEAGQIVEEVCGGRRDKSAHAHSRTGAGAGGLDEDDAGRRAWLQCSDWLVLYTRLRPAQSGCWARAAEATTGQ